MHKRELFKNAKRTLVDKVWSLKFETRQSTYRTHANKGRGLCSKIVFSTLNNGAFTNFFLFLAYLIAQIFSQKNQFLFSCRVKKMPLLIKADFMAHFWQKGWEPIFLPD